MSAFDDFPMTRSVLAILFALAITATVLSWLLGV